MHLVLSPFSRILQRIPRLFCDIGKPVHLSCGGLVCLCMCVCVSTSSRFTMLKIRVFLHFLHVCVPISYMRVCMIEYMHKNELQYARKYSCIYEILTDAAIRMWRQYNHTLISREN